MKTPSASGPSEGAEVKDRKAAAPGGAKWFSARVPDWLVCLLLVLVTAAIYWPVARHDFVNFDDPDYATQNPHVQAGLTLDTVRWAFTSIHSSNWHPLTSLSHVLDFQLYGRSPVGPHLTNLALHLANTVLLFLLLRRMTGRSRGREAADPGSGVSPASPTVPPLTPALSPSEGERENHGQSVRESGPIGTVERQASLLPLPFGRGEGRGEGSGGESRCDTRSLWPSAFVAGLFALHPLHVESVAWVSERKDVLSAFFFFLTLYCYARYTEARASSLEI
jgi:hypothetical protein